MLPPAGWEGETAWYEIFSWTLNKALCYNINGITADSIAKDEKMREEIILRLLRDLTKWLHSGFVHALLIGHLSYTTATFC